MTRMSTRISSLNNETKVITLDLIANKSAKRVKLL